MFSVIFDMDGTLLDTQAIYIPAWEYAGKIQGIENAGEHVKFVCGMNEAGWRKHLTDNFPNLDIEKFIKDKNTYVEKHEKVTFKKGAEKLLKFLKANNIKIAIASGSSKDRILLNLDAVNSRGMFDVIVGGNEVSNGKPAPDIFLLAAQKLLSNPEECFVFEDSHNGIKSGHSAGMKCIGIPDVVPFDKETKELMFAHLSSLDQAIDIFKYYI